MWHVSRVGRGSEGWALECSMLNGRKMRHSVRKLSQESGGEPRAYRALELSEGIVSRKEPLLVSVGTARSVSKGRIENSSLTKTVQEGSFYTTHKRVKVRAPELCICPWSSMPTTLTQAHLHLITPCISFLAVPTKNPGFPRYQHPQGPYH